MKKFVLILGLVALTTGCGVVDSVSSSINGVAIREVETERLVCATAQFSGSISIDCVPKGK